VTQDFIKEQLLSDIIVIVWITKKKEAALIYDKKLIRAAF